jgi:hypothetical protein
MKQFVLISLFSIGFGLIGWNQATTKITGFAPAYVGQAIELFEIQDYLSMKEGLLASTVVKKDSTFSFEFYNTKTQKIVLRSNKNKGMLYIEPNAEYTVFFPKLNKYDTYNPNGNTVEVAFIALKPTDINFKILSFDKWVNQFLGNFYYTKNLGGLDFVKNLDTFKINVDKAYELDSSFFFKTYVKFSLATLDDLQFKGARNRYEKFDFYLHNFPVAYENDAYMRYVNGFYENLLPRLAMETNNRLYLGLLKSSPSLILQALGDEYTLKPKNVRLRELILIKSLSDNFYEGDLPQTNILDVLDSIANHALFPENKLIAKNIISRLVDLVPGTKAPNFVLKNTQNEVKTLADFEKKHVYIQFIDPSLKECMKEVELLKTIHEKYQGDVHVITVYIEKPDLTKKQKEAVAAIPWEKYGVEGSNKMLKDFQVATYPHYVLLDQYGYVVSSPALRPSPNGQYETIDKTFFLIKKTLNQGK